MLREIWLWFKLDTGVIGPMAVGAILMLIAIEAWSWVFG